MSASDLHSSSLQNNRTIWWPFPNCGLSPPAALAAEGHQKVVKKERKDRKRTSRNPETQRFHPTSTVRMESKPKNTVKPASKTEKKEAEPPSKSNLTPADPVLPTEPEKVAQDSNQDDAQEENGTAGGSCETLENLKPFLIGGAVIAVGALLVGLVLLARKK
ncbi:hypothetical protein Baya_7882 [Bagarius yarrelli]|uniref:Cell cycle exit and neuronal differentiation protein 1 n=1 Tax=Bagarius yarrelli TaxID=175774 RepID=A0A556U342_BAGYA|nr:hypothetical protein Baya_7882 [Bagarius yarrelli]